MMDIESVIKFASMAMCEGRFDEAGQSLNAALLTCTNENDPDLILQQLMHLYSHPQNRNLAKAQSYMDKREARQPSAHIALSQSYFQLYIQADHHAARRWAEIAIKRAQIEEDWCTLYSANGVAGFVAGNTDDRAAVMLALDSMESLIGKDEYISYGDAVPFLEEVVGSGYEVGTKVRHLASLIAPLIEDGEFRTRAEALTSLP
jgi:hypothetical protein